MTEPTITYNSFVRRQTAESHLSHTVCSEDEVLRRVREAFGDAKPGYRPGVVLVPISPDGFFSSVVVLKDGDKLAGEYTPRRKGEVPRKHVYVKGGEKPPAVAVDVVLYASTVLAEDGDNELPAEDGNWEVISLNARLTEGEEPMPPETLMANHFGASGGTRTMMEDASFVAALQRSYEYWKDKEMLLPSQ